MDRLTERVKLQGMSESEVMHHGHRYGPAFFPSKDGYKEYSDLLDRLADYEDTDLSPDQAAELAQAQREGRLVVLPCKVGDFAYEVSIGCGALSCRDCAGDGNCNEQGWHIQCYKTNELFWALHRHNFGKTVFLTREEAEAALKEGRE